MTAPFRVRRDRDGPRSRRVASASRSAWSLERAGLGSARKLVGPVLPDRPHRLQGDVHRHRDGDARHVLAGPARRARPLAASTCPRRSCCRSSSADCVFGVGFARGRTLSGHVVRRRGDRARRRHGRRRRGCSAACWRRAGVSGSLQRLYEHGARRVSRCRSCCTCRTVWSSALVVPWRSADSRCAGKDRAPRSGTPPDASRAAMTRGRPRVAAALVGWRRSPAARRRLQRNARRRRRLLAMVVHEDDHVTALELAAWIKERQAGLAGHRRALERRVRPATTCRRPSVIPLEALVATPFSRDETLVLYSEGGAHAAQGWVFLRALGYDHVFFLRGGLYEWLDEVMNPTLAPGASPAAARAGSTACPS